jgi:hypothetical protein
MAGYACKGSGRKNLSGHPVRLFDVLLLQKTDVIHVRKEVFSVHFHTCLDCKAGFFFAKKILKALKKYY